MSAVFTVVCDSTLYEVWETIVAVAIILNCLLTSLMMTFNSVWFGLWFASYVCDIVMISNIIVCFFVIYVDDRGIAYAESEVAAKMYLSGMFALDAFSVLPLDYFVVFDNGWSRASLRLNRSLGLIRLLKFLSQLRIPLYAFSHYYDIGRPTYCDV